MPSGFLCMMQQNCQSEPKIHENSYQEINPKTVIFTQDPILHLCSVGLELADLTISATVSVVLI